MTKCENCKFENYSDLNKIEYSREIPEHLKFIDKICLNGKKNVSQIATAFYCNDCVKIFKNFEIRRTGGIPIDSGESNIFDIKKNILDLEDKLISLLKERDCEIDNKLKEKSNEFGQKLLEISDNLEQLKSSLKIERFENFEILEKIET